VGRVERRNWLIRVGLTWTGILITVAGIVMGVWLQLSAPKELGRNGTTFRLTYGIEALVPVALGVIVLAAAQILAAIQQRRASG
jgi:hypothetical protein